MKKILVVDDDSQIHTLLRESLGEAGYEVGSAFRASEARAHLREYSVDLIVLDVILPDVNGLDLAREVRAASSVPIVMLTRRSSETERVLGLELGADDFVPKPFSPRELTARIRSIFRRIDSALPPVHQPEARARLRFAGWELDSSMRRLVSSATGVTLSLTNAEFALLNIFLSRPRRVLTREQLLQLTRDSPDEVFDRVIDFHILQLRRKLEANPRKPALIKTQYGAGYLFDADVSRS